MGGYPYALDDPRRAVDGRYCAMATATPQEATAPRFARAIEKRARASMVLSDGRQYRAQQLTAAPEALRSWARHRTDRR